MNEKRDSVSIRERISKWAAVEPTLAALSLAATEQDWRAFRKAALKLKTTVEREEQRRVNVEAGW